MHLVYIANTRFPTEKAHGLATAKLCEALVQSGVTVDLLVPRLWRGNRVDPFAYYGIERNFRVLYVPTIDLMRFPLPQKLTFLMQMVSYSLAAVLLCAWRYRGSLPKTVFFSHDYMPLAFASLVPRARVYYDIHHFPGRNVLYRTLMKRAIGFAVQTRWKLGALSENFGIVKEKMVYWPNGTDVAPIMRATASEHARNDARAALNMPREQKAMVYLGSLERWKGVETLVASAKDLAGTGTVYIVGSSSEAVGDFKKYFGFVETPNVVFVPHQSRDRVLLWLAAADVLVLPNTGTQKVSAYYTSPMKLFEYMAAMRPIVASRLPAVLEIVDETSAYLAEPDSPRSFVETIKRVLGNSDEANARARKAASLSKQYTWLVRAEKLRDHMQYCLEHRHA